MGKIDGVRRRRAWPPSSVPERATITNMGAELGATTSVFPSDEVTRAFFKAQGREGGLAAPGRRSRTRSTTRLIDIDLDALVPLAAMPHSPDNVATVEAVGAHRGGPGVHRLAAPIPASRT